VFYRGNKIWILVMVRVIIHTRYYSSTRTQVLLPR